MPGFHHVAYACRDLKETVRFYEALGFPAEMIARHTAVSAEVARAMAEGVRVKFGADFGLATTGYAVPTGESVGRVFVAVVDADGCEVVPYSWPGTRTEVQSRTAKMALNTLRLRIAAINAKINLLCE